MAPFNFYSYSDKCVKYAGEKENLFLSLVKCQAVPFYVSHSTEIKYLCLFY